MAADHALVRPAEPDDAAAMARVHARSWPATQTSNVFSVIVAVAPDVATAKAGEAAAEAEILKAAGKGYKFTKLPNFADGAVYIAGDLKVGAATYHEGAIYVLKGTTFFGFGDVNSTGLELTSVGLQAQAQTMLSRLP